MAGERRSVQHVGSVEAVQRLAPVRQMGVAKQGWEEAGRVAGWEGGNPGRAVCPAPCLCMESDQMLPPKQG